MQYFCLRTFHLKFPCLKALAQFCTYEGVWMPTLLFIFIWYVKSGKLFSLNWYLMVKNSENMFLYRHRCWNYERVRPPQHPVPSLREAAAIRPGKKRLLDDGGNQAHRAKKSLTSSNFSSSIILTFEQMRFLVWVKLIAYLVWEFLSYQFKFLVATRLSVFFMFEVRRPCISHWSLEVCYVMCLPSSNE